jgi:hypothetical protein
MQTVLVASWHFHMENPELSDCSLTPFKVSELPVL